MFPSRDVLEWVATRRTLSWMFSPTLEEDEEHVMALVGKSIEWWHSRMQSDLESFSVSSVSHVRATFKPDVLNSKGI